MHQLMKATGIGLVLAALLSVGASAAELPQETFTIADDRLAVTVASANEEQLDPLNSELTIWVGEVELEGRQTVWVELIDSYGEVIYNSAVASNETHLLPDGRAVVVRSIDAATTTVKSDQSRMTNDGQLVVTRRVVGEGDEATSVEFIEAAEPSDKSKLLQAADFGETFWSKVMAFFEAAADRVNVAWNWLVDTLQA